jgi:hypothetical protein
MFLGKFILLESLSFHLFLSRTDVIYTFVVSAYRDLTFAEIADYAESNCIRKGTISYVVPLLETFTDIQISKNNELIISFKQATL